MLVSTVQANALLVFANETSQGKIMKLLLSACLLAASVQAVVLLAPAYAAPATQDSKFEIGIEGMT